MLCCVCVVCLFVFDWCMRVCFVFDYELCVVLLFVNFWCMCLFVLSVCPLFKYVYVLGGVAPSCVYVCLYDVLFSCCVCGCFVWVVFFGACVVVAVVWFVCVCFFCVVNVPVLCCVCGVCC